MSVAEAKKGRKREGQEYRCFRESTAVEENSRNRTEKQKMPGHQKNTDDGVPQKKETDK